MDYEWGGGEKKNQQQPKKGAENKNMKIILKTLELKKKKARNKS